MLKGIMHTGIGVPDLKAAIKFYESLGFVELDHFHKPEPKAEVAIMKKGAVSYELWQFYDTSHPQVKFINNHVAIRSDDLEKDVEQLVKERGYKLTIPITEGVRLRYAYVQDAAGQNYEIATEKTS